MLAKRIIPCLDVVDGRVVKGVKFKDLKDIGDPVALGKYYSDAGADELVYYDITASQLNKKTDYMFVKEIAKVINIPFSVGGGISTLEDFDLILKSGADKVSINSAAYKSPSLITAASKKYGAQCVVVSIDIKKVNGVYKVFIHGGTKETEKEGIAWAVACEKLGAGELVINSISNDGMKDGYDLELLSKIASAVNIPVIASGGAGKEEDFYKAIKIGLSDGVLGASIFHDKSLLIKDLKQYLSNRNIEVRI